MSKTPNTPIIEGIKAVAIGKKGSRNASKELIAQIITEIQSGEVSPLAQGAFFGALYIKGPTSEEMSLENVLQKDALRNPNILVEILAPNTPETVKKICVRLLNKETLSLEESQELGDFLFSMQDGDAARGLVASILRVRYETADEYEGLLKSLHKTFEKPFQNVTLNNNNIIQIAEPFDGVDHSNLITPLIANHLQKLNFTPISLVGRNSGPKYGNSLLDIANKLDAPFLDNNNHPMTNDEKTPFGWYCNQTDLSAAMDRWVNIRRQIIKRPFMATLERFVNPFNAQIMLASAFHPNYGEKMLTIAERAGYPKAIIIRNGLEGTLAFALKRRVKILCSKKLSDGSYSRHEFEFNPMEYLDQTVAVEEKLINPSLEKNIELIKTYHEHEQTSYKLFDLRIKATCAGIQKAIEWGQE